MARGVLPAIAEFVVPEAIVTVTVAADVVIGLLLGKKSAETRTALRRAVKVMCCLIDMLKGTLEAAVAGWGFLML